MRYKLLSLCAGLLLAGALFTSCQQSTPVGDIQPMYSSSNPAHPALAYGILPSGSSYMNLSVADTDGTNQTALYKASYTVFQGYVIGSTSWSPTGGSIAFVTSTNTNIVPDTLHTIDVSVDKHGAPVGKNLKSIYVFPSGGGFKSPTAWSSTATMGKIAFIEYAGSWTWKLKVIPISGGTVTTVYTSGDRLGSVTWNPDDSRLAIIRPDSNAGFTVMIFNTSTWAPVDSIAIYNTSGLAEQGQSMEWSRSGLNKLAMTIYIKGIGTELYYCAPTTGATPSTDSVSVVTAPDGSNLITWSPNNSSLLYNKPSSGLTKVQTFTTNTSLVTSSLGSVRWKR